MRAQFFLFYFSSLRPSLCTDLNTAFMCSEKVDELASSLSVHMGFVWFPPAVQRLVAQISPPPVICGTFAEVLLMCIVLVCCGSE